MPPSIMVGTWPQKGHRLETFIEGTSMRLLSMDTLNLAQSRKQRFALSDRQPAPDMTHHSPELLQRTPTVSNDDVADPRYWTTYDHYMIEREARALRREYLYRLIANGWRRLRARLTASSPVSAGGPHR
jgi:hypothetical protein